MVRDKRDGYLRLLVCSGNLGNAPPDLDSLAAWLPLDGRYSEVVENTKHPLPSYEERRSLLQELELDPGSRQNNRLGTIIDDDEDDDDDFFDIIVIGMQESTFTVEQVKAIPQLLPILQPILTKAADTVTKAGKAGVSTVTTLAGSKDHTREKNLINPLEWVAAQDSTVLRDLIAARCPSYTFAVRFQRGEMRLEVLVRERLNIQVESVKAQNTGLVNLAANKGGIVGELLVNGTTRLTFLTAHLEAHEGTVKYQHRCQMLTDILDGTSDTFSNVKLDPTLKSHFCFIMGDLNYRTELPGHDHLSRKRHMAETRTLVEHQNWRELNKADELFKALRQKDVAVGFQTLPCYFPPTFKVARQVGFDYKHNRRPSYTDRILWKCAHQLDGRVEPVVYEPIDNFSTSDHKPIRGAFVIQLNERIRPRPTMQRKSSIFGRLSTANLFRPNRAVPEIREHLHILIKDIKCGLNPRNGGRPDPYMSFISYPRELIQMHQSIWQKVKGRLHISNLTTEQSKDGVIQRTAHGCPRTRKLIATNEPDWGDDQIHLVVKSHDNEGNQLNHSGSIVCMTVIDHVASIEGNVIGTFPFNLAHLCVTSRTTNTSAPAGPAMRGLRQSRRAASRMSLSKAVQDVTTVDIDEPLVKNGKQTGWITCTIQARWENEPTSPGKTTSATNLNPSKRFPGRQPLGVTRNVSF